MWGGRNPSQDYYHASNIIWSNGLNDPWSMGGILEDISPDMKAYTIKGAAHHQDLRLPDDTVDPASVKDARNYEMNIIKNWIMDWEYGYSTVVY